MNQHDIYDIINKFRALETSEAAQTAADQVEKLNGVKSRLDEKYMGFEKTAKAVAKNPKVKDPEAVAAAVGRKKYGKEKFQKAAAAGKKLGEASKPDFLDLDKDGNKTEPMKSAAKDAKKNKKEVEEGVYQDAPAKSKVPAFQRKAKGGDWKVSTKDLDDEASKSPTGRAGLEKAKRRLGQMSEGLDKIMRTMDRDIEKFKRTGELTDELYTALYDHYRDEMPYGIAKARTGDPYEWIMTKLEDEIGVDEGNKFSGNLMKARAAGLKKADLDGDGDMEPVREGWKEMQDYLSKKEGPKSRGGEGKKAGTRYGGSAQKDDEEEETKAAPAGEKRGRGRPKKYTADNPRQERVTAKSRKADRTAYTKKKVGEEELDEKAVSKAQQRFMGMAHAMQKGEKIPGASKELKKVAKTMKKGDVKDFAKTKHAGLPEKKKKKTDEMTTSGGVAPAMAPMGVQQKATEETSAPAKKTKSAAPKADSTPKSSGGMQFGKGIYDSFNRALEGMIAESMQINASMNTGSDQGGPSKTLTVTATDESAEQLMMLLKMAGLDSQTETCSACGQAPCGCDHVEEDLANSPDEVTADTEVITQGLAGGLNKPKSTGQTTIPVINVDPKRQGMLEQALWKKYQG